MRTRILLLCAALPAFGFAQAVPPAPGSLAPKTAPKPATNATPEAQRPAQRAPNRPAATPPARSAAGGSFRDLKFPAPRLLAAPQVTRFRLANGIRVLLVENHERPLVEAVAVVRAGSAFDPADRAGLAAMTGWLLRSGGATGRTPERLEAELDALGTTIESRVDEANAVVTMSALKEALAASLALFRSMLTEPSFRQDRLDYQRAALLAAIPRRNDDPREVARREFHSLIYGRDSALARRTEAASIGRISRADVTAFYRRHFFPANVVLAFAGDFDPAEVKPALESLFDGWKNDQPALEGRPTDGKPSPGGYVAVRPDLHETRLLAGQVGGTARDKDAAAVEIAAAALGMTSQSRLMQRARQTTGAAGEIGADWRSGLEFPGAFYLAATTRLQDTAATVRMMVEELEKLRSAELSEDELQTAREAVLARLAKGLDNQGNALMMLARLDAAGYPPDAIEQFQKTVMSATRADVLRAARERLDPARLIVLAVSGISDFGGPIDPRGGATVKIDLTIPPAKIETGEAAATSVEQGKALLRRAQDAAGGIERLAAIRDFTQTAQYRLADGGTETQTDRWIAPSSLRQDAESSRAGMVARYVDANGGWISNGRVSVGLSGAAAKDASAELLRVYFSLLASDRLPGRTVAALDEETVEITQAEATARLVFDPATGLPSKLLYEGQPTPQTIMFIEEDWSDYREVDGIKLPFAIGVFHNGAKYSDGLVSEYKVNQGLKLELLQRRP